MGSPTALDGREPDEGPLRVVAFDEPLLARETEVTQAEWSARVDALSPPLLSPRPSFFRCDCSVDGGCLSMGMCSTVRACDDGDISPERPVERVSWFEAVRYANALSASEGLEPCYDDAAVIECLTEAAEPCPPNVTPCPGRPLDAYACDPALGREGIPNCNGYRLPTESEWEYMARAGTVGRTWRGDDPAALDGIAWCGFNQDCATRPVGTRLPNPWGLYDIIGNVHEWTHDWYGPYADELAQRFASDPLGPETGTQRTRRGGYFGDGDHGCGVTDRGRGNPGERNAAVGFRLVRQRRLGRVGRPPLNLEPCASVCRAMDDCGLTPAEDCVEHCTYGSGLCTDCLRTRACVDMAEVCLPLCP